MHTHTQSIFMGQTILELLQLKST